MDERKYMLHSGNLAHIKLLPEEAEKIAADFASRLEKADYPVRVLIPTDGMRHNTRTGEELYDPEVDEIILRTIREIKNPNVHVTEIPGNMDTEEWGVRAAGEILVALREKGVLS